MSSSKRSRSPGAGPSKKATRPSGTLLFQIAMGRDHKDTVTIHVPVSTRTIQGGKPAASAWAIARAIRAMDVPESYTVAAVRHGDKLPLRNFLHDTMTELPDVEPEPPATRVKRGSDREAKPKNEAKLSYLVDPSVYQLWVVSSEMFADETLSNWYGVRMHDLASCKGDTEFTCQLKLFQPENASMLTATTQLFPVNAMGRFTMDRSKMNGDQTTLWWQLIGADCLGVVCDWSHIAWKPPVRIAGNFGRYLTNSHDYVSRHIQGRIRVQFVQDMFVPQSRAIDGCTVGDNNTDPGDSDSDSGDPADLVVSDDLATFFRGHGVWVVEGERREIDKFVAQYMGQRDMGTYRLVNSGYAQYLVPKIPPSFRF